MNYFKQIIRYAMPYRKYGILNIVCNIFYALFSALSMLAFIPLLEVLFQDTKRLNIRPEYSKFNSLKTYLEEWLSFQVNSIEVN